MRRMVILVWLLISFFSVSVAEIAVHFIDVGQADAALIICDGAAMLIDGGNVDDSRLIYSYLRNTMGLQRLDYVIATHPHQDHVGGLAAAVNACSVGVVYSPVTEYVSKPFTDFTKYVEKQGKSITVPVYGESFQLGAAVVTFVSVPPAAGGNTNNLSLVVRIDYGKLSFLFTGDAQTDDQLRMIEAGADLHADVLKVGHHGSVTSSSQRFIEAVSPSYAVVSVGAANDYGLPDMEVLRMISRHGASVLRTDIHGDIIFTSKDGERLGMRLRKSNNRR